MTRSICYCEPNIAQAGEVYQWKFIYQPEKPLPKNTKIKFDIKSSGRDIDWETPSVNLKRKSNVIYAYLKNGKPIQAKEVDVPDTVTPQFEFTLPSEVKEEQVVTIVMGPPKGVKLSSKRTNGNTAQLFIQRRKTFLLYVDPTGKGNYEDPEGFNLDIKGNTLKNITILAPSFVEKNKRFDVTVRFEDEYGNLTSQAEKETLVELFYHNLRENLNWKLFIPETGFIILPNLYFNEAGIYNIHIRNLETKEVFSSAPIKCFLENENSLFWGLLHGESERVDSGTNIENCLRHFRDDLASNFFASSCFEDAEETSQMLWKLITQNIAEFNEADRFVTFQGFQWNGSSPNEGLRHIIYNSDTKPMLRKKESKWGSLKNIYKNFSPLELISIPVFPMGKGLHYNFNHYSPDFERIVEIYNAWGSSECTKKDGNGIPISCSGRKGVKEAEEGSIQEALRNNCRFGFVAGGLDDRGVFEDFYDNDQDQYTAGLTAIIAKEHSRDALFKALYNRSCYATTGEKIILGFYIAGHSMGQEIDTKTKPGLAINRHISGYVSCTTTIDTIEIIRNSDVIEIIEPDNTESTDFAFDDMVNIDDVTLKAGPKSKPPFTYYYVRVTQEDGHTAWSSPIWIDHLK